MVRDSMLVSLLMLGLILVGCSSLIPNPKPELAVLQVKISGGPPTLDKFCSIGKAEIEAQVGKDGFNPCARRKDGAPEDLVFGFDLSRTGTNKESIYAKFGDVFFRAARGEATPTAMARGETMPDSSITFSLQTGCFPYTCPASGYKVWLPVPQCSAGCP